MSTIDGKVEKCAMCGEEFEEMYYGSTNSFGSCDLDTRPPEMERSTMDAWIYECTKCGYVSSNISIKSPLSREFFSSEDYKNCGGNKFKSDLARKFFKFYMSNLEESKGITGEDKTSINRKLEKLNETFGALLHCAGSCDDLEDNENAIMCRKNCLNIIDEFLNVAQANSEVLNLNTDEDCDDDFNDASFIDKDTLLVIKSDLLRRTKQFDRVINEYESIKFDEDILNEIVHYEIELSKEKDDKCYSIEEAELKLKTTLD